MKHDDLGKPEIENDKQSLQSESQRFKVLQT
jgi:hypothetical protein